MMPPLPACPSRFTTRKAAILELLARPDEDYTDASPKGAVDEGVRPLLDVINGLDGFVTTSSCAGRMAVFLEGRRGAVPAVEERSATATTTPPTTIASSGGKGGGGKWLFVSHDPLVKGAAADSSSPAPYGSYSSTDWAAVFGLETGAAEAEKEAPQEDSRQDEERLVHFKFEPMILHVLTASLAHAQLLLRCASAAGFRESGAVSIVPPPLPPAGKSAAKSREEEDEDAADNPAMPIVAVRSMGLALASVIGICPTTGTDRDDAHCIVTPSYLARLVRVADERFAVNRTRTERFRAALVAAIEKEEGDLIPLSSKKKDEDWEDAEARRVRKKEEGLRRQAALKEQQQPATVETVEGGVGDDIEGVDIVLGS